MFRGIVFSALLAGLIAGLFVTGLRALKVTPLILEAEVYEAAEAPKGTEHGAGEEAWEPGEGLERAAFTALASVLAGIGFALVLGAGLALKGGADWRKGLAWGLGGFAAVHLAPALGLPPELPGMAAADLGPRQAWWLATVAFTAGGLGLIAFAPRAGWKALALVIIVAPHVVGAPAPEAHASQVPAELAAAFVAATLVTNALFWIALGAACGHFLQRLDRA